MVMTFDAMAMTFDGQRSSCRSDVEKCAKEEVSSSLLGKLAPPFLCYKHIPSFYVCILSKPLQGGHFNFVSHCVPLVFLLFMSTSVVHLLPFTREF